MKKKVYIIGTGLAGLSAAYHLARDGHEVEIFEATPNAGGRCRSYYDEQIHARIDNGNHLIMGTNTNVLDIINDLGVADRFNKFTDKIFTFFDNRNGERYYYKAPFPDIERFGILSSLNLFKFILLPNGKTVKSAFRFSPNLYHKIINPLSRSILNTPSETAYAGMLRKVFLKLITAPNGFDHYYPKNNWGEALILPLTEKLMNSGVKIHYSEPVKQLVTSQSAVYAIAFANRKIDTADDIVILATPSHVAKKLIDIKAPDEFSAIINVHFRLQHDLPPEMIGVINSNIEWIFVKPNMISTTYSAAVSYLSDAEMVKDTWNICSKVLGLENKIPDHRLLIEKRATFACTKAQLAKRPKQRTKYKNLFLAGDYINNGLPATIEGAVISGKNLKNLIK